GGTCPASITVLYGDGMHELQNHCSGGKDKTDTKRCECPGGNCDDSATACSCGDNAGLPCDLNSDCPGGDCTDEECDDGAKDGQPCNPNVDCPHGTCAGQCNGGANNG